MNLKGDRFPKELILLSVRWYLRFSLSYREQEEILAERGLGPDHTTVYRWVRKFTPELARKFNRRKLKPCRGTAVSQESFGPERLRKQEGKLRSVDSE